MRLLCGCCATQAKCYCSRSNGCSDSNRPEDCVSYTVVAEYRTGRNPAKAASVKPREVKKWIHFGRPYANHNGGHIWFGPGGFLYYTSGEFAFPFDDAIEGKDC